MVLWQRTYYSSIVKIYKEESGYTKKEFGEFYQLYVKLTLYEDC